MSFQKLLAFTKKVADFADKPSGTPAEIKAQFDSAPEELRQNVVNLIDALKSTATGDSGAKNLGATAISGLTGTDVQTILENIASNYVKKVAVAWNDLSLFYSWTKDPGRNMAQYRKNDLNMVYFRGSIHAGQLDASAVPFNLPVGCRPSVIMDFAVKCIKSDGSLSSTTIQINTVGDAHILNNYDAQIIVLDNISYLAEQ